jgi:hypothetical protein
MQYKRKYKFIAAILLTVFSLNTMAGFACSIGLDMGYNSNHHQHSRPDHKMGHIHKCGHCHKHAYQASVADFAAANDDCCSDQVNSFTKLDKIVPLNNFFLKLPVSLVVLIPPILLIDKTETGLSVKKRFQFVRRSCSLDDTDIRIAIRSFQI